MKLIFTERAWEDYLHWQARDPKLLARLNGLIKECPRTPFQGTGKPEPLRGSLSGFWSRRLTQEHRLVYRPTDDALMIAQCRYNYRIERCERRFARGD
jgi:toxin YoeB